MVVVDCGALEVEVVESDGEEEELVVGDEELVDDGDVSEGDCSIVVVSLMVVVSGCSVVP
jgi:hypothetical protein